MATQPSLGYGNQSAATLDQVNIWMRSTPWYQALLKNWGQDPRNVHLADWQKQQIVRAAQANGVVVDEGQQQIDDSGNFENQGHGLRNTLIVAGIAAAAIATMGAAGVFGGAAASTSAAAGAGEAGAAAGALPAGVTLEGTAAGLGGASTAIGAGTSAAAAAAKAAGYTIDANGVVTDAANVAPTVAGSIGGLSYGDLLKYGLPTAGSLIGGLIQAHAAGTASDAQTKYLEEALAYQKEQDAYARTTDAAHYADTRSDVLYNRATDASRYAGYQGRIAGFISNGQSSNDRMAALLGLPARAPGSASGDASSSGGASQAVPVTPDITAKLTDYYRSQGLTPTGPGTGPTDIAYMAKQIAATGGLTPGNSAYWLDPSANGRITQELTKAGVKFGAPAASSPAPPAPATPPAASAPPASSAATVQMRAPDGSVKTVSADQVDHYTQLGATVLGAAA